MARVTNKEIETAYREGRSTHRSFSKTPTQTTAAGIWFDLSMSPGNPAAQYYFATPLQATALARSTDGGIDHGPNAPTGYRKYLHRFELLDIAPMNPLVFELLDYLAFYPGISMDTGVQDLTTSIDIPRYTAAEGVQMMVIEQNPYVGGAQFTITYEDQDGTSRTTPTLRCNAQLVTGTVATSATATADCTGRYVPLASGVSGVRKPTAIEFLTADVGLLAIVLVKPLAHFAIYEEFAPCPFELLRDFGHLPVIKDDAYLNLLCLPNSTLSNRTIYGDVRTIWMET